VIGWGIYSLSGIAPVIVPALAATAVLVIESLLAIEAIGAVLDRTDVSAISPAE
jgi:hypothetical protein